MPKSIVQTIHAVEFIGEETAWLGVVRETRRSRWVRSGNAGRIKVEKHKLYRGEGPVLYVTATEFAVPPVQEVATFY